MPTGGTLFTSLSSKHVLPPLPPPIEIHKPEGTRASTRAKHSPVDPSPNNLSIADCHSYRRHSMDTSQLISLPITNCTVVKSRSSMMGLPMSDSSNVTDQLLSPVNDRKKSVSSKERLFSVESLHRISSRKSIEHLIKVATPNQQPSVGLKKDDVTYPCTEPDRRQSIQRNEQSPRSSLKQTSLAIGITMDHVSKTSSARERARASLLSRNSSMKIQRMVDRSLCHRSVVSTNIEIVYYPTIQA